MAGLGGNTDPLNLVDVELEIGVFETNKNPKFKLFWVGGWVGNQAGLIAPPAGSATLEI